jgi:hypothetical protein
MLTLFTYELLFAWDEGIRRFCPPLFKFLPFDPPPTVVVQLLLFVLYTDEPCCWLFGDVGIDVELPPVAVVDEPLVSDKWSKQCDAK